VSLELIKSDSKLQRMRKRERERERVYFLQRYDSLGIRGQGVYGVATMQITLHKCVGLFRKRELHKWDSLGMWGQGMKVELIKSDSKLQRMRKREREREREKGDIFYTDRILLASVAEAYMESQR